MNVGIIGAGNIAHKMADTINAMPETELHAVASRNLDRANEFARRHHARKAYGTYEDLVRDVDVELVYIATPHSHHFAHAKLCLENGKNVLCEKAFTANAAQAKELVAIARNRDLFLGEAMWTRFLPMRRTLDELLSAETIGTTVGLTANLCYPLEGKARLVDPNLAGGALLDVGVYPINFALMTFGKDIEKIETSCSVYSSGVDATDHIRFVYRDGRFAELYASMLAISDASGIVLGSEGYIVFKNVNNCEGIEIRDRERKIVREIAAPRQITGFEYELGSAVRAIRAGKKECDEMPLSESVFVMELLDRIRGDWKLKFPFE